MSQWARNNPELADEGYGYADIYDLDRIRKEQKENPPEQTKDEDKKDV